ncbi:hypothetical protein [Cellulomonas fimi]|uniref:Uncharacterized protein n=1 Tax=Cellulomonas fimi TaxID=1708 RepID=A0A7Y0LXJ4_CELFI|nr:hypothetical protein [Cellulomonas fimi]NMR20081.1 hypothetical protein [Cellulomonas fimi]
MTATRVVVPASPDQVRRRRRRAVLRAHHPDLGGDPAELIRQLNLVDTGDRFDAPIVFTRRPTGLRRVTTWWASRRRTRRHPRVH